MLAITIKSCVSDICFDLFWFIKIWISETSCLVFFWGVHTSKLRELNTWKNISGDSTIWEKMVYFRLQGTIKKISFLLNDSTGMYEI